MVQELEAIRDTMVQGFVGVKLSGIFTCRLDDATAQSRGTQHVGDLIPRCEETSRLVIGRDISVLYRTSPIGDVAVIH